MNVHEILLKTERNTIPDSYYWGSVYLANKDGIYKYIGLNPDTLFFMRSLAKPIQASIIADCNIVSDYKLKNCEIAMFAGSHAGSKTHVKVLERLIKKHNIKKSMLLLKPSAPLDLRGFNGYGTKLQNNCSAKHIMMILMSKYLGYDTDDYINPAHPVQKLIHEKQNCLCGDKCEILSFDGCGTPLWAISAKQIIQAYFNLLNDKKYAFIFNAILNNHYLFGGYNRFDSELIALSSKNLFSKVGAGGFVIVYNFALKEILLIKLAQNNNEARRLIALHLLNKLNWLKTNLSEYELNQRDVKVAKYCYNNFFND